MKIVFAIMVFGLAACGCTTKSAAKLRADNAFLAGQNVVLRQQAAAANPNGITVMGAVQNQQVPWVAGLTLQQAIATANYIGQDEPKQIILTRRGESAALEPNVLFGDAQIPLEAGDVIELR